MLRVCINCYGVTTSDSVFQWDLNHTIAISGVDTSKAIAIHFCNKKSTEAIVVPTTIDGDVVTAPIPNILLQEPHNVIAYLHITDSALDEAKTIEIIHIPVIARIKPSEYQFDENIEIPTYERLDARISEFIATSEARYSEFTEQINENFGDHIIDTNNPHGVTKEQVGLGNVDNTADMDKPVSTEQRGAINTAKTEAIEKIVRPWTQDDMGYKKGEIRTKGQVVWRCTRDGGGVYPWDNDNANNGTWEEIYPSDIIEDHQRVLDNVSDTVNNMINPWIDGLTCSSGQIFSHNGLIYRCIKTPTYGEPSTPSDSWECTTLSEILRLHQNQFDVLGQITTVNGDEVNLASQGVSSATTIVSVTLKKGIYDVLCSVNFANNGNGYRRACLLQSQDSISTALGVTNTMPAISGITTSLQIKSILNVVSDTTYYLNAQQNSGDTLSVSGQIRAVRII